MLLYEGYMGVRKRIREEEEQECTATVHATSNGNGFGDYLSLSAHSVPASPEQVHHQHQSERQDCRAYRYGQCLHTPRTVHPSARLAVSRLHAMRHTDSDGRRETQLARGTRCSMLDYLTCNADKIVQLYLRPSSKSVCTRTFCTPWVLGSKAARYAPMTGICVHTVQYVHVSQQQQCKHIRKARRWQLALAECSTVQSVALYCSVV